MEESRFRQFWQEREGEVRRTATGTRRMLRRPQAVGLATRTADSLSKESRPGRERLRLPPAEGVSSSTVATLADDASSIGKDSTSQPLRSRTLEESCCTSASTSWTSCREIWSSSRIAANAPRTIRHPRVHDQEMMLFTHARGGVSSTLSCWD